MLDIDWAVAGGFIAGVMAGASARYGRLCTMKATEDALIGEDYRGALAWTNAFVVAALLTVLLGAAGLANLSESLFAGPRLNVLGVGLGGVIFGLGMTLVGTCSFGLLVRAGGGDLRAVVTA
ncbi:MAG: YeeE/YedE thiosulfate transporter family protein, partial [Hyphomicrobiaceae bacterium]